MYSHRRNLKDLYLKPLAHLTVPCPIKLDEPSPFIGSSVAADAEVTLKQKLDNLVDACSVTIDTMAKNREFCGSCVRPLQVFVSKELNVRDLVRTPFDTWSIESTYLQRLCSASTLEYMKSKGLPDDAAFLANVAACKDFSGGTGCPFEVEDLLTGGGPVQKAVDSCFAAKTGAGLLYPGVAGNLDKSGQEGRFCTKCYWPFLKGMLQETASDKFWCVLQSERDFSEDGLTAEEVEFNIVSDEQYNACLLNVNFYLQANGPRLFRDRAGKDGDVTAFADVFAKLIDQCSLEEFAPKKSFLDDPFVRKRNEKTCQNVG